MPRGRPSAHRKNAYVQALEGNPSKRVIEDIGIDALGEPFIAEHLMDDARGCVEVIKRSMPRRVYSALDSFLLAAYGMAWAMHKLAAHHIANPDFKLLGDTGVGRLSKWLQVLDKQAMMMANLGDRLGLDPRSRASLKLPNARQQKSKFDGLIAQRTSSSSSNVSPFPAASDRENPSD
jgi:phage terminase small subunit